MSQLFSNNIDTTLASPLSSAATEATLTDGSGLESPTAGAFELLTINIAGAFEVVRVTARSGNTVTITRAQEGTTAQAWATGARVFASVTAGTLDRMVQNLSSAGKALAIGVDAAAEGFGTAVGDTANAGVSIMSSAFGSTSSATGARSTALGYFTNASGDDSLAAGAYAETDSIRAIAIGRTAGSWSARGVAIGNASLCQGIQAVALGSDAWAAGPDSIAIGYYSEVIAAATKGIALGETATLKANTCQIGALHVAPQAGFGMDGTNAAYTMSGAAVVIASEVVDLKTLVTHTITVPTGVTFYPEEVGVVIAAADTVSGQPTLRFGITGTEAKYLAATATVGLAAVRDRARFTTLASDGGATTLRAEVTVAATGTTLTGRIYWRGFAVVDQ